MKIRTSDQPWLALGYGNYECNWGMHIAGLYETGEERDEIIFGFLSQGLKDNDLQLYCPTERTIADFKSRFSQNFPAFAHHLENENMLKIFSDKELYYSDGKFSPYAMEEGLANFFKNSQKNGKRNVRATAEMVWALDAVPGREQLMVYESRLNYFVTRKPWVSICLYNLKKFSGAIIMDVLRTHPYVISKGVLTENAYYQDPEEWLEENAPRFLL